MAFLRTCVLKPWVPGSLGSTPPRALRMHNDRKCEHYKDMCCCCCCCEYVQRFGSMYDVHTRMKQGQIKTARAGSRTMMSDDVRRVPQFAARGLGHWVRSKHHWIHACMYYACMSLWQNCAHSFLGFPENALPMHPPRALRMHNDRKCEHCKDMCCCGCEYVQRFGSMYDVHTRMKQGQIKTARAGSRTMMSDDVRRVRILRQEAWVTGCDANDHWIHACMLHV